MSESQRIEKLKQQLSQSEEEKEMIKREYKILKEKTQHENLLKEFREMFYEGPVYITIDYKESQKLSMEMGKDIEITLYKHNAIIKDGVETYIMTKPEMMSFLLNY